MFPLTLLAVLFLAPSPLLTVPVTVPPAPPSKQELVTLATTIARARHLNVDHFLKTIACESNWDAQALGDSGQSHGLVQIYAPAHPTITIEQANDPSFALQFMANEWSKDNAAIWSCWRQLYAS